MCAKVAAIVPVKTFERAKSRMGLGKEGTAQLCTLMLREVLAALSKSRSVGSVAVVSKEPKAEKIASEFGAQLVPDDDESGVNKAVELGEVRYSGGGFDGTLVVPQDLPLLTAQDVDDLVNASGGPPCVAVVPSHSLDGTNALLRCPTELMRTRYDEGSYRTHMQEARAQNLRPVLVYQKRVMADIDSPSDLPYCMGLGEKPHVCERILQLVRPDSQI